MSSLETVEMEVSFRIPFVCPPNITKYLQQVFDGEYDAKVTFSHPRILDIGANCGSYALWSLHRYPGATVYSYEPHPETFKILEENTRSFDQIKIFNYGVGSPGVRVLSEGKNNCGENSFHFIENNPYPTGQHLEVRSPLELPEADILKMDIEGCEMEVLEPLIQEGRRFSLITLEYHNHDLRRDVDLILQDYSLVNSQVHSHAGLGVVTYIRSDLLR